MKFLRPRAAAVAALITAVGCGVAVPLAYAALPHLSEAHTFTPSGSSRAGLGQDLQGDYATYTVARGTSVAVSHRIGTDQTNWDTVTLTRPGGADASSNFGQAVHFNETADTVFVSSPGEKKIYSWTRSGDNTWTADAAYDGSGLLSSRITDLGDTFAEAVDVSGNRLVVGAPNATVDGNSNIGATFVLDVTSGTWTTLLPPLGSTVYNGIAGQSVAIDGDIVVVGVPQYSPSGVRIGALYRYDLSQPAAAPLFVTPTVDASKTCFFSGAGGGAAFGISLSMSNGHLLVGSPFELTSTDGHTPNCSDTTGSIDDVISGASLLGAVRYYDYDLTPIGTGILPPEGGNYYSFGQAVAVSDDLLMVSGSDINNSSGHLLVYDLSTINGTDTRPLPAQILTPSDSGPGDGFGSHMYGQGPSISGDAALIGDSTKNGNTGKVYYFHPLGFNGTPNIEIVKTINGSQSSLTQPGVETAEGSSMAVDFTVTNTGDTALNNIAVTDNTIAAADITCPRDNLAPTISMTCTASLAAPAAGATHVNTATVTADAPNSSTVTDSASAYAWTKSNQAAVSIYKTINDVHSENATEGVETWDHSTMSVKMLVTNTGTGEVTDIKVTDNTIDAADINCPANTLDEGDSMTCTASLAAPEEGHTHTNTATVSGTTVTDSIITAEDSAWAWTADIPDPTPTATPSIAPSTSPSPVATFSPSPSATVTPTASASPSASSSVSPSVSPSPSASPSASASGLAKTGSSGVIRNLVAAAAFVALGGLAVIAVRRRAS